jgi:uncharacterized protein (UPF0261 family)
VPDRTVVLIGTLDTKGAEYAFLRERLRLQGVQTLRRTLYEHNADYLGEHAPR